MQLYGRKKIYTDVDHIDGKNIVKVLTDALVVHEQNAREIEYLRKYLKGSQPVLKRTKKVRKDVCSKVVENIASEIVDHKLGHIWGKPVNTVRAPGAAENADISGLIDMFNEQDKNKVDQEMAEDFCVTGVAFRASLPNPNKAEVSPFCVISMNPATTFEVFYNDIFGRKALGVSYIVRADGTRKYTAYTDTHRYELDAGGISGGLKVTDTSTNGVGTIPIVGYYAPEMFGVFEKAVPLMDTINDLQSNRTDSVAQAVQSILWAHNTELEKEELSTLEEKLAVLTRDTGEGGQAILKYLEQPLSQVETQSLINDLYAHILEITGTPSRESAAEATGSATEAGAAGWRKANYSAERLVAAWKNGERETYKVILNIFSRSTKVDEKTKALRITDLDTQILLSRSNDLLTKTQGILNLLNAGVHPRVAYQTVDLFADPESVYKESEAEGWIEKMVTGKTAQKETGDVTNQPKGSESLENAIKNKATVQKQD